MKKIKLIGATGYGGLGMIEILLRHPEFRLVAAAAVQDTGKPVSAVWPYLEGWCDLPILSPDDPACRDCDCDAVVLATPDGVGQRLAPAEIARGRKVIDYSGDFRFNSADAYAEYARRLGRDPIHAAPDILPGAVYGLTEFHRADIASARLVGNPGCFAMACLLGLLPAVREGLVEPVGLVCDGKTAVSGAGKKPSAGHHFPERCDSMGAYRLSGHQHVMEIEHELSRAAGKEIRIAFTAQVVPMRRGIMATLYGRLPPGVGQAKALDAYRSVYAREPFVKVGDGAAAADTGGVSGSNRCLITIACDERSGTFRVVSHIDNLMKGQAGSAAQNLNALFGLPETLGLDAPGAHP